MVRAFISIDFAEPNIIQKITEIQGSIQKSGAKLRIVNPKILHMTLEFLGEISEKEIQKVKEILDSTSFNSFFLDVNAVNVLPNEKYIRVVYCEINGDVDILKTIQKQLRVKLRDGGYKTDNRPFKPHLTIARVKSSQNRKELMLAINNLSNIRCGRQEIVSIKLKQSTLKSEGPEYSILHEVSAKN
ncbi:MAG: RNA 2',3'-cyclic phosphodiesterase [Candidatus Heimdallarchaeota archaeon]|nr:RNA 2',3'-cyclic phosphodiesterase [Candidatus Heimdallarchaeota archaeon]